MFAVGSRVAGQANTAVGAWAINTGSSIQTGVGLALIKICGEQCSITVISLMMK